MTHFNAFGTQSSNNISLYVIINLFTSLTKCGHCTLRNATSHFNDKST